MTTGTIPFVLSVTLFTFACNNSPTKTDATPSAQPKEAPPAPVRVETPAERVMKATTLGGAIQLAKPAMSDTFGKLDDGTTQLLMWSVKSMHWTDIGSGTDETSFALVMKDPDEERGKRLCVPGKIVEISVEKTDLGKVNVGLMMSDGGNLYRFYGVGSSGTLVQRNQARFCGIVTGRYDYANSGGGTGHAVKMIGMFDLPANRGTSGTTTGQ